jgi:hypothetical protein
MFFLKVRAQLRVVLYGLRVAGQKQKIRQDLGSHGPGAYF